MKKKYASDILKVLHEDAEGLHQLGLIDDAKMREYDEGCLVHEAYMAAETRTSRNKAATPVYACPTGKI